MATTTTSTAVTPHSRLSLDPHGVLSAVIDGVEGVGIDGWGYESLGYASLTYESAGCRVMLTVLRDESSVDRAGFLLGLESLPALGDVVEEGPATVAVCGVVDSPMWGGPVAAVQIPGPLLWIRVLVRLGGEGVAPSTTSLPTRPTTWNSTVLPPVVRCGGGVSGPVSERSRQLTEALTLGNRERIASSEAKWNQR